MGIGGISIWQLLIILAIVVLLFGTKKLRGMGGDLGGALKNFKQAMKDDDAQDDELKQVKAEAGDELKTTSKESSEKVK